MGPHGLLIGATGSGKSELLRTLVLAMAITHSSEVLNFVLVDFKGGATFLGLDGLPHTSAVITNLADEAPLVAAHAGRAPGRDDAPPGAAAERGQLQLPAGVRGGAREWRPARPASDAVRRRRRVQRTARLPPGLLRAVRHDRPPRPLPRRPPAARLPAHRRRTHAQTRKPPVLPHRTTHLLRDGKPVRDRRPRRLPTAQRARKRLHALRRRHAGSVQGRVRLRPVPAARPPSSGRRRYGARSSRSARRTWRCRTSPSRRRPSTPPRRRRPGCPRPRRTSRPCSRWRSAACATPGRRPTRCGCRRSPTRRRWTRCCPRWCPTRSSA